MNQPPAVIAHNAVTRSLDAWMKGRGLAAEIEALRWSPDGGPIPAPGLSSLIQELDASSGETCLAAEVVDNSEGDDSATAAESAARFAAEAEGTARQIAQLCLGVTSHLASNDAVLRAERASVQILSTTGGRVHLVDDRFTSSAIHFEELSVDLAGAICRMIIDHSVEMVLTSKADPAAFSISLSSNFFGDIAASLATATELDGTKLVEIGWTAQPNGGWEAEWADPLAVREPVVLIIETLQDVIEIDGVIDLALGLRRTSG